MGQVMEEKVRIYRPAATPTQSAPGGAGRWCLEFVSRARRWREPVMGWTASGDTLGSQVCLWFDSQEAAIAYARRRGLEYRLHKPQKRRVIVRAYADNFAPPLSRP